ncbi:hypothetical protein ABEB36_009274 [Hypothenemus hampei]|uniref:Uncharacterized protein n=1 Tax=Hypothenemus hampei TaxID=57062 RepID=A0ABD1EFV5_HYPHA
MYFLVNALIAKFRETGSVANKKRNVEKPVRSEAVEIAILGHVNMDPTLSTRQLASVSGINRGSIRGILKSHHFHPYKIKLVHEINEDNQDRRLEFCEILTRERPNSPLGSRKTTSKGDTSFPLAEINGWTV